MVTATRDLVIVGAGPHGLAMAVHAVVAGHVRGGSLEVFDPSGGWLEAWRRRFVAHDIAALRSPDVHHPGAQAGELSSWATQHGMGCTGRYRQPLRETFAAYCAHLVASHDLGQAVTPHRVVVLDAGRGPVRLCLDDGRVVEARRAILATNPGRRRIPRWVADIVPLPVYRLRHADDVDLRDEELGGEAVAVIGGGLTAAQLAIGAIARGAERVHLIARRPLRISAFDVEPGWLGPKNLDGFARLDPHERAHAVAFARNGGSIPADTAATLHQLRQQDSLSLHDGVRVVAATVHDGLPSLILGDETRVRVDRVWLATGTQATVGSCRLLERVMASNPCPVHRGLPELDADLSWPGTSLHLCGRLAALELGPAAGNLWGARMAAQRIIGRAPSIRATRP